MSETKTVEDWLNSVDYGEDVNYVPSAFALEFVNFIKLVNGDEGEENKTPVLHYKMLDNIQGRTQNNLNMVFRGAAKALTLDTELIGVNGNVLVKDVQIGDFLFDRNGVPTKILAKSEVFNKPVYEISLTDGRRLNVSEDHINIVLYRTVENGKWVFKEYELTTKELLDKGVSYNRKVSDRHPTGKESKWYIPTAKAIQFSKQNYPLDPYTVGVILGDGSINKDTGFTRIYSHISDVPHYIDNIPYTISCIKPDLRNENTYRFSIKGIGKLVKEHLGVNNVYSKRVPPILLKSSFEDRLAVLQGLMDTDGTVSKNRSSSTSFTTVSELLANDVLWLVRSLGGEATLKENCWNGNTSYRISIRIDICPFRLKRKAELWEANVIGKTAIDTITLIEQQPSQCLMVDSPTKSFLAESFVVTHNTTLMGEYFFLYLATYGDLPGFGTVDLALYVSDSVENGVKNMRKNLEFRWENSAFLQEYVPEARFTDIRWEFTNKDGKVFIVKGYGAKALALDTRLYTADGYTSIGECKVGDRIYGPDGKLATIVEKSEVFHKPMYALTLEDGRVLKVSEDHINSVMINTKPNGLTNWVDVDLTTKELLELGWLHTKLGNKRHRGTSNKCTMKVRNTLPLEYPTKSLPLDPYTLGLILGDGSIKKNASGIVLTGLKEDTDFYRKHIPYEQGEDYIDKRTESVNTFDIKGINQIIRDLGIDTAGCYHGSYKCIPEEYFFGSVEQRLALLQGLLDTDGSISKSGRIDFSSASKQLSEDVIRLVRSLGGKAKLNVKPTDIGGLFYRPEIWIGMNPFKLPRKADRYITGRVHWDNCNVVDIKPITLEPSQCIAIDNESHQFIAGEYFRTHNTGVRGSKELGKRPQLALLDDLVSDEDARSPTVIASIEDTVYKAIDYALHPTKRKVIWNGTPFNSNDPLYKAVESGAWSVSVYPVCNEFPCSREDFKGAWEDRFTYDYVEAMYDKALKTGKVAGFNQELMLRIISDEDRLVLDSDLVWYKSSTVMTNKSSYNFYITTDFATSEKTSADFSVISVWAYSSNGDWLLVDGICKRQTMDKNVNDLFKFVSMYRPQSVGVEVTGQQGGFIPWLYDQMIVRNIFFNLASENNSGKAGIRPSTNKMQRFNVVLPWFKTKKIWLPEDKKNEFFVVEMLEELRYASANGFKSKHDDSIDTISQLAVIGAWKPSQDVQVIQDESGIWKEDPSLNRHDNSMSSYIV